MQQTPIAVGQNFLAGLTGGMQAGQNMRQANDQNALRNIFATQDVNDPAVQQKIMGLDPRTGMALQDRAYQREQDTYQRGRQQAADGRDNKRLELAVQAGVQAAEHHTAKMDAVTLERERAETQRLVSQLATAKTPEQWDAIAKQNGGEDYVGRFDDRETVFAFVTSLEDTLARQAGPKPQSAQGKFVADQRAGIIPEGATFKGDGPTINNNIGGGSKLYETLDKAQGDMFGALIENGTNAPAKLAMIDQMERYLGDASTPEGFAAAAKTFAGEFGIKTEGLDVLQATQAIINKLVPAQRQPGSGPMSDADLALFKQSLPRLINTRDGNLMITRTLRGMAKYEQAQGHIAAALANREITPTEARKALNELENPLEVFRGSGETKIGGAIDPETQALIDRYSQ